MGSASVRAHSPNRQPVQLVKTSQHFSSRAPVYVCAKCCMFPNQDQIVSGLGFFVYFFLVTCVWLSVYSCKIVAMLVE